MATDQTTCYLDTNIRIAYNFPTDSATLTSFTSEAGNMLAEHVQNQQPSDVWRSTSLADQYFVFELTELSLLNSIIIYNHNLSTNSEIELIIATDSGFTNIVFQEVWDGLLPAYGWDEEPLGWDTVGWGGYDAEVIALNFFVEYFEAVSGLFVKVRLSDNNSDGYIQAGRIIVTNSYQFQRNFGKDIKLKPFNTSVSNLTQGGSTRSTNGVKIRVLGIPFPILTHQDSNILYDIDSNASRNKNVFVDCFPTVTTTDTIKYKMLGFIINDYEEGRLNFKYHSVSNLQIREAK